jgi:hypothetical protein
MALTGLFTVVDRFTVLRKAVTDYTVYYCISVISFTK